MDCIWQSQSEHGNCSVPGEICRLARCISADPTKSSNEPQSKECQRVFVLGRIMAACALTLLVGGRKDIRPVKKLILG